jgi:hypothetical protein
MQSWALAMEKVNDTDSQKPTPANRQPPTTYAPTATTNKQQSALDKTHPTIGNKQVPPTAHPNNQNQLPTTVSQ